MRRTGWIAAAALGLALTGAGTASAAETVYGLTAADKLVTFSSDRPGSTSTPVAITGLLAGETLVGVDVRPATGQLYGVGKLGTDGRLYRIDAVTGAATRITTTPFTLTGTDFGVDFNPVPDRLRIVSDADQNLRLNPNTGNAPTSDLAIAFAATDPNAADDPAEVAVAYTNPVPGNPTPTSAPADTLLFGLEAGNDVLVTQDPPNNGTLNTRAALGIDIGPVAGLDVGPAGNVALAVTMPAGELRPRLYSINLGAATGGPAARGIGSIGGSAAPLDPVKDLAIAQDPFTFAAVTADAPQRIFSFRSDRPDVPGPQQLITGLQPGEVIVGVDTRPATGDLLAVTNASRIYTLDPDTAVASAPRTITPSLSGMAFGVDVNPMADRLRVVSDNEQNQRLNPDTGASAVTGGGTDQPLAYATGDPGFGVVPDVFAAGYTNSVAGAPETLLYVVDAARDALALQNPPNDGTLRSIGTGGLGIGDVTKIGDLDIVPGLDTQLAAFQIAGQATSGLYAVNGASAQAPTDQRGQAVKVGDLGALVRGLAFLPSERIQLGAPAVSTPERGAVRIALVRNSTDGDGVRTTVSYATSDGTATAGSDYSPASGTVTFEPGETVKTIQVPIADDATPEGTGETFSVALSGPTGGAALGSPRSTTVTIADDDLAPGATPPADRTAPVALLAAADVRLTTLKARGVRVRALCNEACTIRASLRLGTRTIGRDTGRLSKAGVTTLRLRPTAAGRRSLGKRKTRTLSIVATATDSAGNRTTVRTTFRALK